MTPIKAGNNWYDKNGVRVPPPNGKKEKTKKEEELKKKQTELPFNQPAKEKNGDKKES